MTSRSDHQQNNRFRAPQFAMGRAQDEAESPGAADALAAFAEFRAASASADASQGAPTVIVRRRRQVERPVEATPDGSPGDAESKRPRVFLLPRTDGDAGADAQGEDAPSPTAATTAATGVLATDVNEIPPAMPSRRRATPDFRRAGPVTIARPLAEAVQGTEAQAAKPSLARLMTEFEELNDRLAALSARRPARLDLDLSINVRWAAIDGALQALKESLPATGRVVFF